MDSVDVEDMFSSLGQKLGWFEYKDINSAIKCMNYKSKSTEKKKKKTKKCRPKNVTAAAKKLSTISSVEELESTSLLTSKCLDSSCSTDLSPTDLNKGERRDEEMNSLTNHELDVVKESSPQKTDLSDSLTFQFEEKTSFDVNDTGVAYQRSSTSTDFSDDSVINSSSNICKKILFNSADSSLLNSKLENSARNSCSSFNGSFKAKSSPAKRRDEQHDDCDKSDQLHSNKSKTDTNNVKDNAFIDLLSSSDDDDDDDDVDSLIQKLLTPHKISVDDSTNKLSNGSKMKHQNNSGSRLYPGNDNKCKQKLLINNKNGDSCSLFAKLNSKWALRDENAIDNKWNSQSESCNSSIDDDDDDDDFECFLEKMKTPAKEIPQWSPKSMKDFIVSTSDESSETETECVSYPTNRKGLETEKLSLFDPLARLVTQKPDTHETGSVNASKSKIVLSPKVNISREIFKKPSINFPQTEIKNGPAIKASSSTFREVTPKGIGALNNIKKHSWVHPSFKFNESESKARSNQPAGDYASFLKSLSISTNSNSVDRSAKKYITHFQQNRVELVSKIFKIYNDTVFEGHFPADFSIHWNNRLLTTAGHCILKSKYTNKKKNCERKAEICLATKICDTPERVRDTLLHEMCHAAVWLVNGSREGHGHLWKSWACKANHIFPYLPLVKRCHGYDIATKYTYKCVQCGYSFGRHSKSLDTTKKVCGYCRGQFEVLLSSGTPSRAPNKFALFVKEHYGMVKKQENCSHKDVMKILSEKFKQIQI